MILIIECKNIFTEKIDGAYQNVNHRDSFTFFNTINLFRLSTSGMISIR